MNFRKIKLSAALITVIAFASCSKDDGAIPDRVTIEYLPAVTTNVEGGTGTTGTITFSDQAAFQGKFKLALYFKDGTPPTKLDVVVRKNASNANVKVYKANVTALPASFTVTAAEIATLFGGPLALNDTYDFGPDVYVDDKKYESFPAVGTPLGQGITGMSGIGYGAFVRYSVK